MVGEMKDSREVLRYSAIKANKLSAVNKDSTL